MEFEQIPTILTQIQNKLDYVIGRLDEMPGISQDKPEDDELMTLD